MGERWAPPRSRNCEVEVGTPPQYCSWITFSTRYVGAIDHVEHWRRVGITWASHLSSLSLSVCLGIFAFYVNGKCASVLSTVQLFVTAISKYRDGHWKFSKIHVTFYHHPKPNSNIFYVNCAYRVKIFIKKIKLDKNVEINSNMWEFTAAAGFPNFFRFFYSALIYYKDRSILWGVSLIRAELFNIILVLHKASRYDSHFARI